LKDHKQQQKVVVTLSIITASFISALKLQDREKKVSKFEQSGLTEEELLAKQQELFAASRAKFQSAQQ
jgi:hypothetical protein